ncbi:hypothetical protein FRC20_006765 [Serendipita sp. 405]|nr:hypothetical protein FRC20_006765 [Serendipita sp. 405]
MSLAQALFNDYLRMFDDDPFLAQPSYGGLSHSRRRHNHHRSHVDPFFDTLVRSPQLSLHLSEEENGTYVVEAQVPGVKKENLEVKVGDGGRSLTVSGRILRRGEAAQPTPEQQPSATTTSTVEASTSQEVTKTDDSEKQVQTSRGANWSGASTFTRTVWLPNPVDSSSIKAKLEDGILTIKASRANMESVNVTID